MRSKVNLQQVYAQTVKEYVALAAAAGKKISPGSLLISKSSLVMTAAITSGMSVATFNVNATSGGASAWEVRLQQTDSFTVTRIGFYAYGLIGDATGPAGNKSYKYWTYAPYELGKNFITIQPIWDSGTLNMNLNSVQYVKNWLSNQHYQAPRTPTMPFEALTTSGAANAGAQASTVLGEDGMVDMEPTIRVQGNWNNSIQMTFNNPQGIAPVTNFSYTLDNGDDIYLDINYVNLVFEGLIAQNVTAILGTFTGSGI